jgi:predicted transcriptional regulator
MFKQGTKYRTKSDILAQIIAVAKDKPVTKTRISYDCFLSYDYLNECLDILVRSGLLCYDKKMNNYATTEKGLRYLELCTTLYKLHGSSTSSSNSSGTPRPPPAAAG